MSTWKVSKEKIEIFDHPNAERLSLGKVGAYQVVVQKGLYSNGDEVIFAPEKSVLSGKLREEYANYLAGDQKDRVRTVVLRGERSCGIIIPNELVTSIYGKETRELPTGEDLSELFCIEKYVPMIPAGLEGTVVPIRMQAPLSKHDVEQFGIYASNFVEGEEVSVTEKLHGGQAVYAVSFGTEETRLASSKGMFADGLEIVESLNNTYWVAAKNSSIFEVAREWCNSPGNVVQMFGELLPCQGGYNYGFTKPTVRLFDVHFNGFTVPYEDLPQGFKDLWVPILYTGPYDPAKFRELAKGTETVSGKGLHIKEGVVIRPRIDRRAADGTWLKVKVINPSYKETGDEIS